MRLAFASCIHTTKFPDQPVWDAMRAQAPDVLVLLGDSHYMDIGTGIDPRDMTDDFFAETQLARYWELLSQPQFKALVLAIPPQSVHAVWDDHDFFANNSNGAEERLKHGNKLQISTAMMTCFRQALATRFAPGAFPTDTQDPRIANPSPLALATPSIELANDIWLHLSDGRSHRTGTWLISEARRTMFGTSQLQAFGQLIQARPQALHLWASGSTLSGYKRYKRDQAWLLEQAARARMLVLSGDIHRNELAEFHTGGFPLHEATSSGVAVKDAVIVGARQHNHGLLDVSDGRVDIQLFRKGDLQMARSLDRQTWLPI